MIDSFIILAIVSCFFILNRAAIKKNNKKIDIILKALKEKNIVIQIDDTDQELSSQETAKLKSPEETGMITEELSSHKKTGITSYIKQKAIIWIGAIALSLSGFFLIKSSLDSNLFTPTSSLSLSTILALSLIYLANMIRIKSKVKTNNKISQSLAGSGVVILYATCFGASSYFQILPETIAIILMIMTTIATVLLSLYFGSPVAFIGLTGGFATPPCNV